jgi:hypothetical protein
MTDVQRQRRHRAKARKAQVAALHIGRLERLQAAAEADARAAARATAMKMFTSTAEMIAAHDVMFGAAGRFCAEAVNRSAHRR